MYSISTGQYHYCIPQPFSRCLISLCSSLFDFNSIFREGAYCLLNSQHSFRRYLRYYGHSVSNFPTDEAKLGSLVSRAFPAYRKWPGGLERGKALGTRLGVGSRGEGCHSDMGIPAFWASPFPKP